MAFTLAAAFAAVALLAGMLAALWAGRRAGRARPGGADGADPGPLDSAVFGLFGLLIAFTFSGASGRFDARRELVAQEANAIGTAWLRLDLLPAEVQPELRGLFRQYVEVRLAAAARSDDPAAAVADLARGQALQGRIWTRAVEGARATGSPAVLSLVAPALNEMFDITTTRQAAAQLHPPLVVYLLLVGFGLASAFVAGLATAHAATFDWWHALIFAAAIAAAVYVILELEFPRLGLIRIDATDQLLRGLLAGMKP